MLGHVSMRRAHVIMLCPPMYHGTKVIATTDGAPLSPKILIPRRVHLADFNLRSSSFPRVSMNFFPWKFRDESNPWRRNIVFDYFLRLIVIVKKWIFKYIILKIRAVSLRILRVEFSFECCRIFLFQKECRRIFDWIMFVSLIW